LASITIRNLDDKTKSRLRIRAAHKNCSMEEEARNILSAALAEEVATPQDLGESIVQLFGSLGGIELQIPPREPVRDPPNFHQ
jgi:plasmid stability protein